MYNIKSDEWKKIEAKQQDQTCFEDEEIDYIYVPFIPSIVRNE